MLGNSKWVIHVSLLWVVKNAWGTPELVSISEVSKGRRSRQGRHRYGWATAQSGPRFGGIYPREVKTHLHRKPYAQKFIAALRERRLMSFPGWCNCNLEYHLLITGNQPPKMQQLNESLWNYAEWKKANSKSGITFLEWQNHRNGEQTSGHQGLGRREDELLERGYNEVTGWILWEWNCSLSPLWCWHMG